MGQTISKVEVKANVVSPSNPEFLSVVSESMEEYATYDSFFDEYLRTIKDPPGGISSNCVNTGDNTFEVTKIYPNLAAKDGSNHPPRLEKVHYDKEKGIIYSSTYLESVLESRAYAILHRGPLRLEFWFEKEEDGKFKRTHSPLAAKICKGFVDTVLSRIAEHKEVDRWSAMAPAGDAAEARDAPLIASLAGTNGSSAHGATLHAALNGLGQRRPHTGAAENGAPVANGAAASNGRLLDGIVHGASAAPAR